MPTPTSGASQTVLAAENPLLEQSLDGALTGEDRMWEGILVTPRVRAIVRIAEERADQRDVEPIDLFEAIVRSGGGLAADILSRAKRNTEAPLQ